jgi:glyoxylase I family protein
MSEPVGEEMSIEKPARRFLHICYCCDDDQAVAQFLVDGFDLVPVMRTADQYNPGTVLGLDYEVHSIGNFIFDRRGPRTSPAIEVQGWYDPVTVGSPPADGLHMGINALGFAVPSVDDAVQRLTALGCTVVADGDSPTDARSATLRDVRGVTLDVVEDDSLQQGESQIHHLRINVTSIDESLPFYDMLGFELLARDPFTDGAFAGVDGDVVAEVASLRLPDEPFEVRLIEWTAPTSHGEHPTVPFHAGIFRAALGVDDTRASYDFLTGTGATFDREPLQVELAGTPVPDMWITFITDPSGIPYEFVQRARSIFR